MKKVLLLLFCFACSEGKDDTVIVMEPEVCVEVISTYSITLNTSDCNVDIEAKLGVSSQYTETFVGDKRRVTFNNIANHPVGEFPRRGNPNTIAANTHTVEMTLSPQASSSFQYALLA